MEQDQMTPYTALQLVSLTLLLLGCPGAIARGASCLDPNGRAVEWWAIYKLPVITDVADRALGAGLGYATGTLLIPQTSATEASGLSPVKGVDWTTRLTIHSKIRWIDLR